MLKKKIIASLLAVFTLLNTTVVVNAKTGTLKNSQVISQSNVNKSERKTIIKDRNAIEEYAKKHDLNNSNKITEIQLIEVDFLENKFRELEESENKLNSVKRGAYYIKPTTKSSVYIDTSNLLRSTGTGMAKGYYDITIEESVSTKTSCSVTVDAEVLKLGLGIDVTRTKILRESRRIDLADGEYANVEVCPRVIDHNYQVYKKGFFSDDYITNGSVIEPVGLYFIITKYKF